MDGVGAQSPIKIQAHLKLSMASLGCVCDRGHVICGLGFSLWLLLRVLSVRGWVSLWVTLTLATCENLTCALVSAAPDLPPSRAVASQADSLPRPVCGHLGRGGLGWKGPHQAAGAGGGEESMSR